MPGSAAAVGGGMPGNAAAAGGGIPGNAAVAGGGMPGNAALAVQAEIANSATRTTFRKFTEIERMKNILLRPKGRVEIYAAQGYPSKG
jgi:hypothetical protein